jgi:hypothetical protein
MEATDIPPQAAELVLASSALFLFTRYRVKRKSAPTKAEAP